MPTETSWAHRFLEALPPWGERSLALILLGAVFLMGVVLGVMLATTWEIDAQTRVVRRRVSQVSSRPTLHQRLDALEQRLQAIEHRLTP